MFVDDAVFMKEVKGKCDCLSFEGDLNDIQTWADTWLMEFYPIKVIDMRQKKVSIRILFSREYAEGI